MGLYRCVGMVVILFYATNVFSQEIKWLTWEEAAELQKAAPRKLFVDVYTHWCGWCKRMDQTTLQDKKVINYINEKFYPIKLNAEQKDTIIWEGMKFPWVAGGRDGYNKLAYDLLDGKLSYPTFVLMNEEYSRVMISPGYKDPETLLKELRFAGEDFYKNTPWESFKASNQ